MYDIITIGSSVVDIFVLSNQFQLEHSKEGVRLCQEYGAKIDVDSFQVHSGGGGGNTAVGFARLGFAVGVVTETGKDSFANIVLEDFHTNKVSTNLVIQEKREETGGSVALIGKDGGRSILVHRGASSELDPKDLPVGHLSRARWVHLSSIAGREDTLRKLFEILSRSNRRYKLSWNPGRSELVLLKNRQLHIAHVPCEVFSVNRDEWNVLEGVRDQIIANVPQIVITEGNKGCEVIIKGFNRHFSTKKVTSIDDTGAGDAFITAYIAAQLKGQLPETAVQWGIENATSVVQHVGARAGLLRLGDMEKVENVS